MADKRLHAVLQHLRTLVQDGAADALSDRELLECFVARGDETAFAALVERHGRMVLGVCRRVLRHAHDADDASQAAFLVLARKAESIRKKESLASWLHGVAYHVATNLRRDLGRRKSHEMPLHEQEWRSAPDATWREVTATLDEELARLPERYRAPLILCYLEGKTRDEAAQLLGWNLGSLRGRLERGRELLRNRLIRRGLELSVVLLGGALRQEAEATMLAAMARATVRAAVLHAAGKPTTSIISTEVAALVNGAVKTMFLSKLKCGVVLLLAIGLTSVGAGISLFQAPVAGQQPGPVEPGPDQPARPPASEPVGDWILQLGRQENDATALEDTRKNLVGAWLLFQSQNSLLNPDTTHMIWTFRDNGVCRVDIIDKRTRQPFELATVDAVKPRIGSWHLEGPDNLVCVWEKWDAPRKLPSAQEQRLRVVWLGEHDLQVGITTANRPGWREDPTWYRRLYGWDGGDRKAPVREVADRQSKKSAIRVSSEELASAFAMDPEQARRDISPKKGGPAVYITGRVSQDIETPVFFNNDKYGIIEGADNIVLLDDVASKVRIYLALRSEKLNVGDLIDARVTNLHYEKARHPRFRSKTRFPCVFVETDCVTVSSENSGTAGAGTVSPALPRSGTVPPGTPLPTLRTLPQYPPYRPK